MSTWPWSALRDPGALLTRTWLPGAVIVVLVLTGCALQRADSAGRSAFGATRSSSDMVGLLAFTATSSAKGRREVFTIRTDGSHRRQLTTRGGYYPAWSPDGARIAFVRGRGQIWLMDAGGGSLERVGRGYKPAWSPDGKRLSYECEEVPGLCVWDAASRTETVIVAPSDEWPAVQTPTWSPDGAWIAFARYSSEGDDYTSDRQLFRVRPDGSELTAIPNTAPLATSPAWSPDGSRIFYSERYDGRGGENSGDLWAIRPDGGGRTPVLRIPGMDDQAELVTGRGADRVLQLGRALPQHGWDLGDAADATGMELVTRNGGDPSWHPSFVAQPVVPVITARPSGPRIAYVATTDTGNDLFTVRSDGTRTRRLTSGQRVFEPVWSPDHSQLLYGRYDGRSFRAAWWVMDARTGKTRRVVGEHRRTAALRRGRRMVGGSPGWAIRECSRAMSTQGDRPDPQARRHLQLPRCHLVAGRAPARRQRSVHRHGQRPRDRECLGWRGSTCDATGWRRGAT